MFLIVPTYARVDIHVYLPWSAVCTVHRFINVIEYIKTHCEVIFKYTKSIDVYTVDIHMNSQRK